MNIRHHLYMLGFDAWWATSKAIAHARRWFLLRKYAKTAVLAEYITATDDQLGFEYWLTISPANLAHDFRTWTEETEYQEGYVEEAEHQKEYIEETEHTW